MRTRWLWVFVALCLPVWPQEIISPNAPKADHVIQVVHVHGNAKDLAALAGGGTGVYTQGDNLLNAIVVKGSAAEVERVVHTIQELDAVRPAAAASATDERDVELIVYVVAGSANAQAGKADDGADLLAPVYKQLRTAFPFKSYQLVDTMLMRSGQDAGAMTSGAMRTMSNIPDFNWPALYTVEYERATASAGAAPTIHLSHFKFQARVPYTTSPPGSKESNFQQANILVQTNVDLREGQKVVVGTSNVETASTTLFLVLAARMVP